MTETTAVRHQGQRRMRRMLFAGVLAVALTGSLLALRAHATTPGKNGLIAFTRYRLQDAPIWSEIFVARPDGSGAKRVSHSATAVEDDQAHWSPDGKWIVFDRCEGKDPCSLWLVRPDGSGQRRLSPPCPSAGACPDESGPAFTPDGKRIVFTRAWGHHKSTALGDEIEHSAIATVDLRGHGLTIIRQLAPYAGDLQSPRISPDGRLVVFDWFFSSLVRRDGGDAIFVAKVSGGAARRLTPWRLSAGSPDWSPDGKLVLFKQFIPGGNELTPGTNLYTVGVDGKSLTRLTNVGAYHYVLAGSFSPDGGSIVLATDENGSFNPRGGTFADVFTMRLGATARGRVTHSANLDGWPSWGTSR